MGWRSEAGQDRSRVLARCADQGSGAAALTAQFENELWLKARSWKDYCETLARTAASLGHESCLRVLHEMGGDAAASLAAADEYATTPAHRAALNGQGGCLRVLHELRGEAAASVAEANEYGATPAHSAASYGQEGCLRVQAARAGRRCGGQLGDSK